MARRLFIALLLLLPVLMPALAFAQGLPVVNVVSGKGGVQSYSLTLQLLPLMTVLTLLPSMLLMVTSFVRIIIVFSMDSSESWEEVSRLRDMVHEAKDPEVPIVVVGNKSDLPFDDAIPQESIEATVVFDWENGYVECSAKDRININKIFKELLQQAKSRYDFTNNGVSSSPISIVGTFSRHGSQKATFKSEFEEHMRRRQSLPAAPPDLPHPMLSTGIPKRERSFKALKSRRASLAALRRDSCKVS